MLDCYRLARWYHQSPNVFLDMPLSEVRQHRIWTARLADIMRTEAADDGD